MKKRLASGFSMFSFDENIDLEWALKNIRNAGYDEVEPILSSDGYLNENTTDEEVRKMGELIHSYNLTIPSIGVWSLWKNNIVSNNIETRQKAISIVKRQIEIAKILGAKNILVVPGYVGCDFLSDSEHIPYDIAYERAIKIFKELSIYAKDNDVVIGIENVWNKFLLSPIEMKNFIDEIDSDYVKVYFDVGNCIYSGYAEDWIRILGQRICQIHLCDYRRTQNGLGAFVDLFAGDVDFEAVSKQLACIGYNGPLMLEMLPNYKKFPQLSCSSNIDKINYFREMIIKEI